MYNEDVKRKYIESYSGLMTQQMCEKFFNKLKFEEEKLDKDLSDFTIPEIKEVISVLQPKNDKQAKVYASFVSGYLKWTFDLDFNPLKEIDSEYYNQFA